MKVATLDVSVELLTEFCKALKAGPRRSFVVKENPLPEDANVVDIRPHPDRYPRALRLFIESESFAEVPEGGIPYQLPDVVCETVYDECTEAIA